MGTCDMCGTRQAKNKARIESVVMDVCEECSKYGQIVSAIKTPEPMKKQQITPNTPIVIQEIVQDYAALIRKSRESLRMTQKEFAMMLSEKESMIHNLESGRLRPGIELARKLEKALKIRLVEQITDTKTPLKKNEDEQLTVGDLLKP